MAKPGDRVVITDKKSYFYMGEGKIVDVREFGSNLNSNRGAWAEMKGCNAVMKYNQYKRTKHNE